MVAFMSLQPQGRWDGSKAQEFDFSNSGGLDSHEDRLGMQHLVFNLKSDGQVHF